MLLKQPQVIATSVSSGLNYTTVLNTGNPPVDAVTVQPKSQPPPWDQVLAKLKATQAQEAAQAAAILKAQQDALAAQRQAEQARSLITNTPAVPSSVITVNSRDVWAALRNCESGGNYAENTGNGYYGAYQYDLSTWDNYGGYTRPDLAPPGVQDAKAHADQASRGWAPWPSCSSGLGL